jgi:hemerythrin-like domain-containing protein
MSTNVASPGFDSVTGYLTWDHDRLEAVLDATRRLMQEGRWADARETYDDFDQGLARHIRIEEDVLFPLFEARTGIVDGPTAVMREEHRAIRSAVTLMRQALEAEDAGAFQEGRVFLESVMPAHNAKEEHVLYPTTDRMLEPSERARLVARLQRA